MLTPNPGPNECHSTLMSVIRGIYLFLYQYIDSLGIEYDFSTTPNSKLARCEPSKGTKCKETGHGELNNAICMRMQGR